jgi:predicted nucleotidyltransferase
VQAVLLIGSAATGYADEHSDIDLQIIGSIEADEQSVDGVHIEWTPITLQEIEEKLSGWEDDAALYTYANMELLYDRIGVDGTINNYSEYPPSVLQEKLYAGWFYGTGNVFDARKAAKRGDTRVKQCAAVSAVEQFAALSYLLDGRFPPYWKWLFRDLPTDFPGIDAALSGDVAALERMRDMFEPKLRDTLDDERIEKPYLFQPEFGRLG